MPFIVCHQTRIADYSPSAILQQEGGRAWLNIPDDYTLHLDELHLKGGAHLAIAPNQNRNRVFRLTVGRFVGTDSIHDR